MFGLVLLLAGWFFIRNAVIHDGDFFGVATEEVYREKLKDQGIEVFKYFRPSEEMSFWEYLKYNDWSWFVTTTRSFVGKFGTMKIQMYRWLYYAYYAILLGGIFLYISMTIKHGIIKSEMLELALFGASSTSTFSLSLIHSYFRDNQPQGRYVITCIILLSYLTAKGFEKISSGEMNKGSVNARRGLLVIQWILIITYIVLLLYVFLKLMTIMFTLGSEKWWINNY